MCIFLSRTLPLGQRTYTIYCFWILDAKVAPPPHATWYVRRVGLPPALKALTCRLGAPAHTWKECAFSYPGRCRSGNAPTLYNVFGSLMPRWPGRPMPLGMRVEYAYHPLSKLLHVGYLGAPKHPWSERACSYPGRCRSGNAPTCTLYNVFGSLMPRWPGRPMPLGMRV